jgi:hypothetical protein
MYSEKVPERGDGGGTRGEPGTNAAGESNEAEAVQGKSI